MKTIKLDCNGHNAPAYGCNKPGDNSGEYVPAEVAKRLYDTLERVLNSGDWFGSALEFTGDDDLLGDQLEEVVRDALAAADGEEV